MEQDRIGLTTKISELEKTMLELKRKREQTIQRYAADAKERSGALELEALENEIKSGERQIQEAKAKAMRINRDKILEEATQLANEKKSLQERISAIEVRGEQLRQNFEINIPKKRIQTSSKYFVKVKKQVQSPGPPSFDLFSGFPVPSEKNYHEVQDLVPSLTLKAHLAAGWQLCENEKIPEPEVLTPENSVERGTISIPDLFFQFLPEQSFPTFIPLDLGRR